MIFWGQWTSKPNVMTMHPIISVLTLDQSVGLKKFRPGCALAFRGCEEALWIALLSNRLASVCAPTMTWFHLAYMHTVLLNPLLFYKAVLKLSNVPQIRETPWHQWATKVTAATQYTAFPVCFSSPILTPIRYLWPTHQHAPYRTVNNKRGQWDVGLPQGYAFLSLFENTELWVGW